MLVVERSLQVAAMTSLQARKLALSIPLLMVISRRDPFYPQAETLICRLAAHHAYSRYLPIGADHSSSPMAASAVIEQWIEGLPR